MNVTYEFVCFSDLAYEFSFSDKKEAEKKIKRRLKYYKLGEYDQDRVDYIRCLKNELYSEISQCSKSKYYCRKSKSRHSDYDDFNLDEMVSDFTKKYDEIEKGEMFRIINFAIYLYYLR